MSCRGHLVSAGAPDRVTLAVAVAYPVTDLITVSVAGLAVVFGGLAELPLGAAKTLICAGTFLALSVTCWAVTSKFDLRTGLALPLAGTTAVLAILSQPFRSTLDFGQVNAFLMVLVAVDCLVVRDRRYRGVLVGLAAAIKLTPAIFVLYFLLRRDWRRVRTPGPTRP